MSRGKLSCSKLISLPLVVALCGFGLFTPLAAHAAPKPSLELEARFEGYDLSSKEIITVIVELEDEPVIKQRANSEAKGMLFGLAQEKDYEKSLNSKQEEVKVNMRQRGLASLARFGYTMVFNGMAVDLPANKVAQLENIPGVKAVYPDIPIYEDLDVSVPAIGAPTAWQIPPGHDGSGIVVGVIDGWIDWQHPDLGAGFGPGYRVIGGWDFWLNQPIEQSGQIGIDGRHGTHVGSTVAAVAPGASLINYRVSSGGGGTGARLLAAMEMAVRDSVDVLTMSMGSSYGHTETPWAKAVDNVVLAGIVFTCSNGNNGPVERTTGTYAHAPLAISVGNANALTKMLISSTGTGRIHIASMFTYSPGLGEIEGQTLEYVDCGFGGYPADFYDGAGNSKVMGKVALVSRGGPTGFTSFRIKHDNARDAGAVAVIVYNNVSGGVVSGSLGSTADIPTLGITLEDGTFLKTLANQTITMGVGSYNLMSSGSSRGPSSTLDIKPDVAAPGTSILAPVPFPAAGEEPVSGAIKGENGAWYAPLSGTSMATPHVAGAAAILRGARPDWSPEQIKLALMNTALDIKQEDGHSYRPIDQGAGMINIPRALNTKLFIKPGSLSVQEATVGQLTRQIELESIDRSSATYKLRVAKHNPANDYQVLLPEVVTLAAGARSTLPVTLVIGANLPPSTFGESEYCGYIYFENVNDPTDDYRLPYHFVYGQPVSQFTVAPHYLSLNPAATQKTVTFTYTLGTPVNDVRFRIHGLSDSYFGYTGPQSAGQYSFVWDGSLPTAGVEVPEGSITIYPQYQLTPGGPWVNMTNANDQGAMAYARLTLDSSPPELLAVKPIMSTLDDHVVIQGLIDDLMFGLLDIGGEVLLNGKKLVVHNYADLSQPDRGYDYGIFTSDPIPVDLKKGISFTLQATDLAGNTTLKEYTFAPVTLDNPEMERVLPGPYLVSGQALSGVQVTINGEEITVDEEGRFTWQTEIEKPGRHQIDITATVPQWQKPKPLKIDLVVIGVPNENAVGQVKP